MRCGATSVHRCTRSHIDGTRCDFCAAANPTEYNCTREFSHIGSHIALDIQGRVRHTWGNVEPKATT